MKDLLYLRLHRMTQHILEFTQKTVEHIYADEMAEFLRRN